MLLRAETPSSGSWRLGARGLPTEAERETEAPAPKARGQSQEKATAAFSAVGGCIPRGAWPWAQGSEIQPQ